MCLGKKIFKYIFCIFVFVIYFLGLKSQIEGVDNKIENPIHYNVKLKIITNNLTIFKRTIIKSVIETFWSVLKEVQPRQDKIDEDKQKTINDLITEIDLYEFGKIYSNLCLEEFLPSLNSSKKQKLIELIAPVIISYFVINCCIKKIIKSNNPNSEDLPNEKNINKLEDTSFIFWGKLFEKLLTKLLNANLLQTKKDPLFFYIRPLSLTASFYKHDKNKIGCNKFFNVYVGAEKIFLNSIKSLMQSNIIKFKEPLNKKHYKKASAKTIQIIIKPFIHQGIILIEDKIKSNYK